MNDLEYQARAAIDAAHAADPERVGSMPAEAVYADQIETWIGRLVEEPSLVLRLAARGQHLERWAIPRADYPAGRSGYLRWRGAVHARQATRIRELLAAIGTEAGVVDQVARLVAKMAPREDAQAQALEDAACLVFLETELLEFQGKHDHAKVIVVLQKTWKKMSPRGRELALSLTLPGEARELVRAALAAT